MRIRTLSIALGTLAALTLATAAQAADKVILQLDWLPTGDKQAGYIGKAKGFFTAEGIDIEIRRGNGAADALNRVATGGAQYAYCDIANVMATRPQGAKVKAIMSITVKAPHAIITRKDTGIKTFADLVGKTVGTAPSASSNLFFPLVIEEAKIDLKAINILNVDPTAVGSMLLTKRIDAAMLWVANAVVLEGPARQGGMELHVMPFLDGKMDMYGSVIIASEEQMRTQADLTRRFVRAMRRSFVYMNDNLEETARAVHAENPQQDPVLEAKRAGVNMKMMFNEVTENGRKFGLFEPALLQKTKDWLVRAKQIDAGYDAEDAIDRTFLPPPAS